MPRVIIEFVDRSEGTDKILCNEFECDSSELEGWVGRVLHTQKNKTQVINLGDIGTLLNAEIKSFQVHF